MTTFDKCPQCDSDWKQLPIYQECSNPSCGMVSYEQRKGVYKYVDDYIVWWYNGSTYIKKREEMRSEGIGLHNKQLSFDIDLAKLRKYLLLA